MFNGEVDHLLTKRKPQRCDFCILFIRQIITNDQFS